MAIRIDNAQLLDRWRSSFLQQVATIKDEESKKAATQAADNVRRRVMDLQIEVALQLESVDYMMKPDVSLNVRFGFGEPGAPSGDHDRGASIKAVT